MPPEEQVLVIERGVFDEVGAFHGLCFDVEEYLDVFFDSSHASGGPRFMRRADAETDPGFKQLIPYVIMRCGDSVLSYVRGQRAGETRLVGQRSIGIGGHINPIDEAPLFGGDFRDTYLTAVKREVAEEVNVEAEFTDTIVALLNDDTNEVGKVHLGVVHVWDLSEPKVSRREQMITQLQFMQPDELRDARESMETWSQLCLDGLNEMARCRA